MLSLDQVYHSDCLEGLQKLPDECVQCCVTSPPYWGLRDYGTMGQIGAEDTPQRYIAVLADIFEEVKRTLTSTGTLWLNMGDVYWNRGKGSAGNSKARKGEPTKRRNINYKNKDLMGLPWEVAFELRRRGWYLRQDIIWHKPNCMPESVTDRCTKAHEYIFLFSKSPKYYFDHLAIKTPTKGKKPHDWISRISRKAFDDKKVNCFRRQRGPYLTVNRRSVWSIPTVPYKGIHTATFPSMIPELCIRAGSKKGDIILDPFFGAGTTGLAAKRLQRHYIGFELNLEYIRMAEDRILSDTFTKNTI